MMRDGTLMKRKEDKSCYALTNLFDQAAGPNGNLKYSFLFVTIGNKTIIMFKTLQND